MALYSEARRQRAALDPLAVDQADGGEHDLRAVRRPGVAQDRPAGRDLVPGPEPRRRPGPPHQQPVVLSPDLARAVAEPDTQGIGRVDPLAAVTTGPGVRSPLPPEAADASSRQPSGSTGGPAAPAAEQPASTTRAAAASARATAPPLNATRERGPCRRGPAGWSRGAGMPSRGREAGMSADCVAPRMPGFAPRRAARLCAVASRCFGGDVVRPSPRGRPTAGPTARVDAAAA